MRRVVAGVCGWAAALVPLVVVNLLSGMAIVPLADLGLIALSALLGGIVLGGAVSGMLASRGMGTSSTGGLWIASAIAAVLYGASLLGLMVFTAREGTAPAFVAQYPHRAALGVAFLTGVLMLVSVVAGILARPRQSTARARGGRSATAAMSRHPQVAARQPASRPAPPGYPGYSGYPDGPRPHAMPTLGSATEMPTRPVRERQANAPDPWSAARPRRDTYRDRGY